MFHDMDIDHSGEVDYSEFLSATLSAQKHSNASVMAAFNTLDADRDGYITKSDLVPRSRPDDLGQHRGDVAARGPIGEGQLPDVQADVLLGMKGSSASPTHVISSVAAKAASPGMAA